MPLKACLQDGLVGTEALNEGGVVVRLAWLPFETTTNPPTLTGGPSSVSEKRGDLPLSTLKRTPTGRSGLYFFLV
ncbi:hypothetical protein GCM10008938_06310 [Deinococcus roseus]|uniref:Uncharacterized protein n=1 Tax=Deinococcus roseus TaxID=392414 RepID=A0ABQ2CX58_9DEIO|nr:hypothetical protein GCM10008938_06310 [Deinococcus roseus]